jgi:hypothetical protein
MRSDAEKINPDINGLSDLFIDGGQSGYHMDAQLCVPEAFPDCAQHFTFRHKALSDLKRGGPEAVTVTYLKIGITGKVCSSCIGCCLFKADLVFVRMGTVTERGVTNDNLG